MQARSHIVKTMAIRLSDEISAQLTLVAQLEGTSIAELIRQAIDQILEQKRDQGDLVAKAEAALAEIDQEAQARRRAIQAMLRPKAEAAATAPEPEPPATPQPKPTRGRRPAQG